MMVFTSNPHAIISIIKMINFMNTLPQKEQLYYQKLMYIIGINVDNQSKKKQSIDLNNEEMFDFCRFNERA